MGERPLGHGHRYLFTATAAVLITEEKQRLWPAIQTTIRQMATYLRRTDRNIRVFRLMPVSGTVVSR